MSVLQKKKGFSLIELLVAISIIAILAVVIYTQLSGAGAKSRDAVRKDDIQKIGYAIELWYQEYGRDPNCSDGIQIEEGGTQYPHNNSSCPEGAVFLNHIESVLGELPHDPLGPDNNDYFYYYDSWHNCHEDTAETNNLGMTAVYAVNLEVEDTNIFEYCATQSGNHGGYKYTDGLRGAGDPVGSEGSINPSIPYVFVLKRGI